MRGVSKSHIALVFIVVLGILLLTESFLITSGVLLLIILVEILLNQYRNRRK